MLRKETSADNNNNNKRQEKERKGDDAMLRGSTPVLVIVAYIPSETDAAGNI